MKPGTVARLRWWLSLHPGYSLRIEYYPLGAPSHRWQITGINRYVGTGIVYTVAGKTLELAAREFGEQAKELTRLQRRAGL